MLLRRDLNWLVLFQESQFGMSGGQRSALHVLDSVSRKEANKIAAGYREVYSDRRWKIQSQRAVGRVPLSPFSSPGTTPPPVIAYCIKANGSKHPAEAMR